MTYSRKARTALRATIASGVVALSCLIGLSAVAYGSHPVAVAKAHHHHVARVRAAHRHHLARVEAAHDLQPLPARSEPWLPAPLVSFEQPYVPPRGDPIYTLPRQAQVLAACVRWREGGDTANQPNLAGMYQYMNETLWLTYGGGRFSYWPSGATAEQQDVVFVATWLAEQFYPWVGDPCIGALQWITHNGAAYGWY